MQLSAGYVLGQQSAPADYKLASEDVLASIDLATEIDSVQERELRLSRATIAPGGHVGLHRHQAIRAIVYLLSGRACLRRVRLSGALSRKPKGPPRRYS